MILRLVPNLLSALRLGLALLFPWAPPLWQAPMIIAAGFSDWLDGFLARKFDLRSTTGVLLDATADKLFALSVLLTLVLTGRLAWWQMAMVIARDLAVSGVAAYLALRRRWSDFQRLVPRVPGKVTTGFQFAFFLAMVLPQVGLVAQDVAFVCTAACSAAAAADYLLQFAAAFREDRRAPGSGPGNPGPET